MTDIAAAEGHIQSVYYVLAIFGLLGGVVVAYARKLQTKIEKNSADLAAFKVQVASEYLSASRFDSAKLEIMTAIHHVGTRIDSMFHYQRPAE